MKLIKFVGLAFLVCSCPAVADCVSTIESDYSLDLEWKAPETDINGEALNRDDLSGYEIWLVKEGDTALEKLELLATAMSDDMECRVRVREPGEYLVAMISLTDEGSGPLSTPCRFETTEG